MLKHTYAWAKARGIRSGLPLNVLRPHGTVSKAKGHLHLDPMPPTLGHVQGIWDT